jgi:hypothetical protein
MFDAPFFCNSTNIRISLRMESSGMLRRVALVRTEELRASFIRVTRIGELVHSRFLQEPHDVISQETPFFIVTAVKTSNLTLEFISYRDLCVRLISKSISVCTNFYCVMGTRTVVALIMEGGESCVLLVFCLRGSILTSVTNMFLST